MKLERRWLLAPPAFAVLLVSGPFRGDDPASPWLTTAFAIAAVSVVLVTSALVFGSAVRSESPVQGTATSIVDLRVVRSISLSRQSRLHVVRFADRTLLIGDGADGVRLVASSTDAAIAGAAPTKHEPVYTIPAAERARATPRTGEAIDARLDRFRALARQST